MKIILFTFAVIHLGFASFMHALGNDIQAVRTFILIAAITGTATVVLNELEKLRSEMRERDTSERER